MARKTLRKKYATVTFKRVTLLPKDCEQLLGKNSINRMLNNAAVARMAHGLISGDWAFTGETIVIDCYGNVLDGQHRLAACFLSGVPIDVLVVYGVGTEAQAVMGRATKRSTKDDLEIRNENNAKERAALANKMLNAWGASNLVDRQKIEIHDLFRDVIEFTVDNYASKKGKGPSGVVQMSVASGIARAWFYVDDKSVLEQFCKVLVTGIVSDEASEAVIITFRDYLQSGKKGMRPDPALLSLNAQETIRAYVKGIRLRLSRVVRDALYPMPHTNPAEGVRNGATNKTVEWFRESYPIESLPTPSDNGRKETRLFVSSYKQGVLSARAAGKDEVNMGSVALRTKKAKEKELKRKRAAASKLRLAETKAQREAAGLE